MELGHILNSDQTREILDEILEKTAKMKAVFQMGQGRKHLEEVLKNKLIVLLFNQPSTRTRTKFELAGEYLGAKVLFVPEIAYTSVVKEESWRNTIKTYARLGADIIVIRHPQNFAPHQAAVYCNQYGFKTKIINAGDGNNFHPTQTFLDLFTLKERLGEKFGKEILEIAIGADPKNARVLHSLAMGLAQYPVKLTLVSWQKPKTFLMPRKYLRPLIENQREFREVERLTEGEKFDAIYWVRHQIEHVGKGLPKEERERLQEKLRGEYNQKFGITPAFLKMFLKEDGIFLHPGPRDGEIDDKIDSDPRVKDGDQVENGIYSSMALYQMMLNPKFRIPKLSDVM